MKQIGDPFTVIYNNKPLRIETYKSKGVLVYHVLFTDRQTLFITRTTNANNGNQFWASVPEDNRKLAAEIGDLIDQRDIKPKQISLF